MAAAGDHEQVLRLRCADFSTFAVPVSLALQWRTRAGERVLHLPRGVSGSGVATADLDEFDREFSRGLTHDAAVDLIHAAYHLGNDDALFHLPRGVSGSGVATAVTYWAARSAAAAADLDEFDHEFVRGLTHDAAVDLIHAAYHLGDDALFDLLSGSISKSLDESAAAARTF